MTTWLDDAEAMADRLENSPLGGVLIEALELVARRVEIPEDDANHVLEMLAQHRENRAEKKGKKKANRRTPSRRQEGGSGVGHVAPG